MSIQFVVEQFITQKLTFSCKILLKTGANFVHFSHCQTIRSTLNQDKNNLLVVQLKEDN